MINWLCGTMLRKGIVDGIIHVTPVATEGHSPLLFNYSISRSLEDLKGGAKSKYYPIQLSAVLDEVKNSSGKYVLVGLPCFIKAVRRLARIDPVINKRIPYMIGLICGHLKSRFFAELLASQMAVPLGLN